MAAQNYKNRKNKKCSGRLHVLITTPGKQNRNQSEKEKRN
jgi:hypothetical protein